MPSNNIRIVEAFVEAINQQDTTTLSELMADDYVFVAADGTKDYKRDEHISGWKEYFRLFPDYKVVIETIIEDEDVIALFGSASGTYNGNRGLVPENKIEMPAAWKAIVSNDKITHWQVYADWSAGTKIIDEDNKVPAQK